MACVESDVLCANLFMWVPPALILVAMATGRLLHRIYSIFRRFFRCNQMRCDACVGGGLMGPEGGAGGDTRVLNYPQ